MENFCVPIHYYHKGVDFRMILMIKHPSRELLSIPRHLVYT